MHRDDADQARGQMAEERAMRWVLDIIRNAFDRLDEQIRIARETEPEDVACGRGCAHCCHLIVEITLPEVLILAHHLRTRASAERLDRLSTTMDTYLAHMDSLSREEQVGMRLPCPLLEDSCCSVYTVRPLTCRGWCSLDEEICRQGLESPKMQAKVPIYLPQFAAYVGGRNAFTKMLREKGLHPITVDLVRGLRWALRAPNPASLWLAGEVSFEKPAALF